MLNGSFKYCSLLLLAVCQSISMQAQFGQPIINVTFGNTNASSSTASPPPDLGATDFTYTDSLCPPQGSFTVFRRVNANGCFSDSWIPLYSDHTPGLELGNMMLVNSFGLTTDKLLFTDTVTTNLCAGSSYAFSMAVINLMKPSSCSSNFPFFTLRILNLSGNQLAYFRSSPLGYASDFMGYKFAQLSLGYVLPPGVNGLILQASVANDVSNIADRECGADFAIDDIVFAPAGPKVAIDFDDPYKGNFITSVCFQDNKTVSLSGVAEPFYNNIAYQWQQSTDSGSTWQNINGAVNTIFQRNYAVPDTFLIRLKAAEATDISNVACGVVSNVLTINVDGIPANYNAISNAPVCAGTDLKFDVIGGATYEWNGPNGFYDYIQFPHIYSSALSDSGWYYVTINTLGGCKVQDSVFARVIGTDVKAGNDTAICIGQSTTLSVNNGTAYSWSPSTGLSATDIQHPVASPLVTTKYTVDLTDVDGCSDTAQVLVQVKNKEEIKASFSSSDYICMPVDSLLFKYNGKGPVTSWQWNFDNGNTAADAAPLIQYYYSPGNRDYRVMLTVSDSMGCSDEFYKTIHVADMCNMEIPKAFTPNGDGRNDYFWPLNAYKATDVTFTVYNRNGIKIFETKQWPGKWDGTYKGEQQDPGTYVWMFQYTDAMGKRQIQKGTVVLLR